MKTVNATEQVAGLSKEERNIPDDRQDIKG